MSATELRVRTALETVLEAGVASSRTQLETLHRSLLFERCIVETAFLYRCPANDYPSRDELVRGVCDGGAGRKGCS